MNHVVKYTFLGILSAALYYSVESIKSSALSLETLIKCMGAGALGGLLPGVIADMTRRNLPLVQSWLMLLFLVYGIPIVSRHGLYWAAFLYGYMGHLLWMAYMKKLSRI